LKTWQGLQLVSTQGNSRKEGYTMNNYDFLSFVFNPCNNFSVSFFFCSCLVIIDSMEAYNPKNRK